MLLVRNGKKEQAAPENSVLFQRMICRIFQRGSDICRYTFAAAARSSRSQIKADKAEKRASIFRNKTKLIEGTVLRLRSQTGNCHNDPGGDHETAGDRSDQRPRSPLSENQQINTQRKTDRSDQKQEAGQVD